MFKITERQYGIIIQQAMAAFPQETGGILGGHGETILGILPIANKAIDKANETFGISADDVERAYHFLVKHQLEYLGIYHTHPRGAPYPSTKDLSYKQKHLFIIGLKEKNNPELYAWKVDDFGQVRGEDIKIISDVGATVVDIMTGKPRLSENIGGQELDQLTQRVNAFIQGRKPEYHRYNPTNWDASTFSTFA
ncbi:Mov34/MPN/PAD-1 family protein [Candidatus Saganbacteria bacterium]|nr:Mov34/MPN/PAD-1 family protein [Candidatus Saganbacteria bacterium]